ncbi:MAG TPA: ribonuclease domain-containing protein [Candidatus Accumulibacter phosphatis]|nr:MAG: Guanyl-specific ribonuclease Sa [Candidatus Accumulibacter sp. SK-11]HCN67704.1 ribonuclease [Accumulibacter sp.]HRL77124.1 ribonuclease domain-containing protein [Candidatus Accumulibacter phosphatis]HRQ95465.1 ribonuclease domain-containing protein [Candidatus Accumulibacter phosphatis]
MLKILAVARLLLLAIVGFCLVGAAAGRESRGSGSIAVSELPPEAVHTLRLIHQGGPFPYPRKDGSVFGNFEKRLPLQPRGYYREYTVPTPGRRDRGARRIVAGSGRGGDVARSGEYYYTADHYLTFSRIREQP